MSSMDFILLLTSLHIELGGSVMNTVHTAGTLINEELMYMEMFVIYWYLGTVVSKFKQVCLLCILE